MGIYTQELQTLYVAYFKRPADVEGLAYWEQRCADGLSLATIAHLFSQSQESTRLYAGMSNAQMVNALYQNLFGRDAEADGKAYWTERLEKGEFTRVTIASALMQGAQGSDVTALLNKVAAASEFTATLDTHAGSTGYAGETAGDIARAWLAAITAEPVSLSAARNTLAGTVARAVDAGHGIVQGRVVDGYLKGATVFADANGNGVWDEGEAKTVTDELGNFTLTHDNGPLLASGGTDLATQLQFAGVMRAPVGATIVNPLTTLHQALIAQGQSIELAQATLAYAFGLDVANVDIDQWDPLQVAFDANASAANKTLSVQIQAAAIKVQNVIIAAGQALSGASGGGVSVVRAENAVIEALATVIRNDTDGVVNLSDKDSLQEVLLDTARILGNTPLSQKVEAIAPGFATILAATEQQLDAIVAKNANGTMAAGLAQGYLAQVQTAAHGTIAPPDRHGGGAGQHERGGRGADGRQAGRDPAHHQDRRPDSG